MPAKKPLNVLKNSLHKVKSQIGGRKKSLLAHLGQNGKISPKEEEWLDIDANLVTKKPSLTLAEAEVTMVMMITQSWTRKGQVAVELLQHH